MTSKSALQRVVIGLVGTNLDAGTNAKRWERWRPTLSLCQQDDLLVSRMELLYPRNGMKTAEQLADDIRQVSPETTVNLHLVDPRDPWDFEEVYAALHDFTAAYPFDTDNEEYLIHITTGTHVAQICLFLLTETRRFPAKLVQTSPKYRTADPIGDYKIIDLDLSKYDSIAARFERELTDNIAGLKSGIATRNTAFNKLIEEIEHVATHSVDPILLMGATGAGKSQLARRIFELRKHRRSVQGSFIEVNCATLRGDMAMSTLFGHTKGAYTGAASERAGLLRAADKGVLFLDEIGELGLDEQAMLLRALEEKRFLPVGADSEVQSNFQLIAGTNRDLQSRVAEGKFRDDLLARINLWTFCLPPLRDRREDIEPNLDYELEQFAHRTGRTVRFNSEARATFLGFATSAAAAWLGNFRDLSASVTRMATLAAGGRITEAVVDTEVKRLRRAWALTLNASVTEPAASPKTHSLDGGDDPCASLLTPTATAQLDRFDRAQLAEVLRVCRESRTLSEAGRTLFAVSRTRKASGNDADRLRKYLARFGLTWEQVSR